MSVKQVRFTLINTEYSPIPNTPSSLASTSSLPSSPSQSALEPGIWDSPPSSKKLDISPETIPAELAPWPLRVHSLLLFSDTPLINYDLSQHPSTFTTSPAVSLYAFSEPATDPPLWSAAVVCPHFPWSIPIVPNLPDTPITVWDLLLGLYRGLRLAVHPTEYEAIPSPEDKLQVNAAYDARWRKLPDASALEESRKGVKRVDFLRGRTLFLGLSPAGKNADVWQLNVS